MCEELKLKIIYTSKTFRDRATPNPRSLEAALGHARLLKAKVRFYVPKVAFFLTDAGISLENNFGYMLIPLEAPIGSYSITKKC